MRTFWQKSAALGGAIWLLLIISPLDPQYGIGTIEKLFLLGPLVTVPLGLGLLEPNEKVWWRWLQPLAAVLATISFFVPAGQVAGVLTVPWVILSAAAVWEAFPWREDLTAANLCFLAARLFLPAGAAGLLQSRWGMSPLGFHEPWLLLVAVHFHFAAFVAPIMAGETLRRKERRGLLPWVTALLVCGGSPVLATGYVLHEKDIRVLGAMMLVAGVVMTSLWSLNTLSRLYSRWAWALVGTAAMSVVIAMGYAAVYAVADYCGEVWIAIPQMARTHGVLNALAFSLGGLAGWNVEQNLERKWYE